MRPFNQNFHILSQNVEGFEDFYNGHPLTANHPLPGVEPFTGNVPPPGANPLSYDHDGNFTPQEYTTGNAAICEPEVFDVLIMAWSDYLFWDKSRSREGVPGLTRGDSAMDCAGHLIGPLSHNTENRFWFLSLVKT